MRLRSNIIPLISAILVMAACTPKSGRDAVLARLAETASDGKYMYAHQDDLCYGHSWYLEEGRSDVKDVCGEYPAIAGFDLGGIELGDSLNIDKVPFDYMRRVAEEHLKRGGLITYSWHPRNPLTGGDAWDISSDKVVESILPGGSLHDVFMDWMSRAADFLGSVKDPAGNPAPAIFRPWHENIGSWFWWGGRLCTPDQYIALWRMMYDYFTVERNLKNLVWAYSPNSDITEEEYFSRYPGDGYVDILGCDCYQYKDELDHYRTSLREGLSIICEYSASHGKIAALTETGHESIPESDWWTGILDPIIKDYPISYVLTWRNACDRPEHFHGPFPGAVCEEDFKAFHNLERTVFLQEK